MRRALLLVVLGGCRALFGFEDVQPEGPPSTDAGGDGPSPTIIPVTHLAPQSFPAGLDVSTANFPDETITFDTTALTLNGTTSVESGGRWFAAPQDVPDGPEVAVLVVA